MDYQGNPNKDKEEKPKKQIEKVVTGEVIQKPKSIGQKFKNIFLGGDLRSSARFVAADVILPAFRDIVVDAITAGARRAIYGDSIYRRRQPEYRSRVSYSSYSSPLSRPTYYPEDPRYRDPRDPRYPRANLPDQPNPYRAQRREHDNIVLAQRSDAELVVERLLDIIEKYEVASLADLYDLLGWPTSHVDNKWGWTYLNNVEVRQVRDGYLIDLPPLEAV
jgi:hypothetical protein